MKTHGNSQLNKRECTAQNIPNRERFKTHPQRHAAPKYWHSRFWFHPKETKSPRLGRTAQTTLDITSETGNVRTRRRLHFTYTLYDEIGGKSERSMKRKLSSRTLTLMAAYFWGFVMPRTSERWFQTAKCRHLLAIAHHYNYTCALFWLLSNNSASSGHFREKKNISGEHPG